LSFFALRRRHLRNELIEQHCPAARSRAIRPWEDVAHINV
jgi:hypothetical protein